MLNTPGSFGFAECMDNEMQELHGMGESVDAHHTVAKAVSKEAIGVSELKMGQRGAVEERLDDGLPAVSLSKPDHRQTFSIGVRPGQEKFNVMTKQLERDGFYQTNKAGLAEVDSISERNRREAFSPEDSHARAQTAMDGFYDSGISSADKYAQKLAPFHDARVQWYSDFKQSNRKRRSLIPPTEEGETQPGVGSEQRGTR